MVKIAWAKACGSPEAHAKPAPDSLIILLVSPSIAPTIGRPQARYDCNLLGTVRPEMDDGNRVISKASANANSVGIRSEGCQSNKRHVPASCRLAISVATQSRELPWPIITK